MNSRALESFNISINSSDTFIIPAAFSGADDLENQNLVQISNRDINQDPNAFSGFCKNIIGNDKIQRLAQMTAEVLKINGGIPSKVLYVTTGLFEGVQNLTSLVKGMSEKNLSSLREISPNLVLNTASVVVTIFYSHLAGIIFTSISLFRNSYEAIHFLSQKQYVNSLGSLYKISCNSLYLTGTFLMSPELLLVSTIADLATHLFKSFNYFKAGNYIEGVGHLIIAGIKGRKELPNFLFVKRKWTVLTDSKFIKLRERINKGRNVDFLKKEQVLKRLSDAIEENRIAMRDENGKILDLNRDVEQEIERVKGRQLNFEQFVNLFKCIEEGNQTDFLENHPLKNLTKAIADNRIVIKDEKGEVLDLGAHFSGFGKDVVKGQTLNFRVKKIDGKEITELDFKVNHVFRKKLESIIEEYQNFNADELNEFLFFSDVNNGSVQISEVPYYYNKYKNGEWSTKEKMQIGTTHQIDFEGLGKINIGASKNLLSLYDRVTVQMDKTKEITDLHMLLSLMEMDPVLQPCSTEDVERMKIGQLFRTFYPSSATTFERTPEFFTSPIANLKQKIINLVPAMKTHFEKDLPKMVPIELVKGKIRYGLDNLAKEAKDVGARALMSGITGTTPQGVYHTVASILKTGALSSQTRFDAGLFVEGASSHMDHEYGSADSVFTRLLTQNQIDKGLSKNQLSMAGAVQLIYSLDALNTMTYQYHLDNFGTRKLTNNYIYRPSILDFVKGENAQFHSSNEVMSKEIIPPNMIVGCMVSNETAAKQLTQELKKNGVVTKQGTEEFVNNIPLKEFIHVGTVFTDEVVKHAHRHLS